MLSSLFPPHRYQKLGSHPLAATEGSHVRKTFILFAISLTILVIYLSLPLHVVAIPEHEFHLVIPASSPSPHLCKALLSSSILGYPSPAIINWNKEFHEDGLVGGGSHLGKITGIYEYLSGLDASHGEDLMLIVDAYDIWFQLRPQTLIDRYFEINRRANARIQSELGNVAEVHKVRQEIVFGAQKRWWPWTRADPPYYAVPDSTLPKDVYGPDTDSDIYGETDVDGTDFEINRWIKYRQRYLNSGVAIGTVRAFLVLFEQALDEMKKDRNFGSDQYIFSHIFGQQELWRENLRRKALSDGTLTGDWSRESRGNQTQDWPEQHLQEVSEKAGMRDDGKFEFGIGLDYESEIALNTVFAEDDTEWRNIRNSTSGRLASDIASSMPPFAQLPTEYGIRQPSWEDVPLLTDIWTAVAPAVIHHTAHVNGTKARRETWWPNIWFSNHSRALLDAQNQATNIPIAIARDAKENLKAWWPFEKQKNGARDGRDEWMTFDELCSEYEDKVF